MAPIEYRDFWDVPRIFHFADRGQTYLFDCPFEDDTEDFAGEYRVYLMPPLAPDDTAGSWVGLPRLAVAELGRVPIATVQFDPTKRQFVDASVLDALPTAAAQGSG